VVLVEEETGVSQTLELSVTSVLFERGYEAVAFAHGPEDIEYEVEVETGESQTVELSLTVVPFARGYEAVAYAHGPEDIEYEVEAEAIAA
jgi:predicted GNAT superfamily acetyltransferase